MKLSDSPASGKQSEPATVSQRAAISIRDILANRGISEDVLVSTAIEFYVPHPGLETRGVAEKVFREELKLAFSDPNLCLLLYSAVLLEEKGESGELPDLPSESYERDLTYLIVDEVIGSTIATYIAGHKGSFEYVRFDKSKPGILGTLGPFMDDAVAGLLGGVSSNMYTRGMKQ